MNAEQPLEHASFEKPDEVHEGPNWRLELLNLADGAQVDRITLQPGGSGWQGASVWAARQE